MSIQSLVENLEQAKLGWMQGEEIKIEFIDSCIELGRQAIADFEKQEPFAYYFEEKGHSHRDDQASHWFVKCPCDGKLNGKDGLKLYDRPQPQEELSKLTAADDINQLCMMGELPIQFEDLADWVADGKWPVNTDAPTKQLVETLLRALENEQDRNRLEDVCVDATDAAVLLGRQYLGLVNKQEGVV